MKRFTLFIISITFCTNAQLSAQSFIPVSPDTSQIKQIWRDLEYSETIGYTYLSEYYESETKKVILEMTDPEWIEEAPCSFWQKFEHDIYYEVNMCHYAGVNEKITFPKMETEEAQKLINELFHEKFNAWESEYIYAPIGGGAGCYYMIQQDSFQTTTISWGCGC